MNRFRDDPEFPEALEAAAARLRLQPAYVEKDYWVTQVLRAIYHLYPHGTVLKGGTSLSKGHALIDRFSEDVDVLVLPQAGQSARIAESRLHAMTVGIADFLGLSWSEARLPGRGRDATRGDYLHYPSTISASGLALPIKADAVLLETGYSGGREPSALCDVGTLIGGALGLAVADYDDLAPFRLPMLDPARTLIEKCYALHHIATMWRPSEAEADEEADEEMPRFGRHYYDIFRLLNHAPVRTRLADRAEFAVITADVERISRSVFGAATPRPPDGLARSPAFLPPEGSPLRAWLERAYGLSLGLVSATARPPTLGEVLARVAQYADLL